MAASATGKSPFQLAKRRFIKNRPAVLSLLFLAAVFFISLFAYAIIPDGTHHANFRIDELAKRPPGYRATILLKPVSARTAEPGWFSFLMSGKPDRFQGFPVQDENAFSISGDTLKWTGLRGEAGYELLPLWMLPVDRFTEQALKWKESTGKPYLLEGDKVTYTDAEGAEKQTSLEQLKSAFQTDHVMQRTFWLGTDSSGRDILSRLLLGSRVSLGAGLLSVAVSLLLGLFFGSIAGFFRGRTDAVVMWFVSVVWSVPTLLLALTISFALGKGFQSLFIAIGVSTWVEVARLVRGQIFSLREMQYVEATRAIGMRPLRTIIRHILPNVISPVIIIAAANFASAILIEAGLSFLGVGVQPPMPSWGAMIYEGYTQIYFDSGLWLAIYPGLAIILVVIALNWVGQGLRDALDPKYVSAA